MNAILDPRITDFDPGRDAPPRTRPQAQTIAAPPPRRALTVGEVMSPSPVTLPPDADVLEVAGHLLDHGRSEVVIVGADGPLGVLTPRDLTRHWADAADIVARAGAETLLPSRPRRLLPGLDIVTAAAVLVEEELEAIPVVDSYGNLVGVLGARHILAVVAANGRALVEPQAGGW
jgi:CBS domain-containing protein